jgi:hypothetical protein
MKTRVEGGRGEGSLQIRLLQSKRSRLRPHPLRQGCSSLLCLIRPLRQVMEGLVDLGAPPTTCRASSVLRKNAKEFGPARMFDGSDDTCWNSDQVRLAPTIRACLPRASQFHSKGSPQVLYLLFQRPVSILLMKIMFQGGFSATVCLLSNHLSPTACFISLRPSALSSCEGVRCKHHRRVWRARRL